MIRLNVGEMIQGSEKTEKLPILKLIEEHLVKADSSTFLQIETVKILQTAKSASGV